MKRLVLVLGLVASTAALAAPSPEAVVRQMTAAFNAHDVEALVAACAPDIRWSAVSRDALTPEAEGAEALAAGMRGYFGALPTVRSTLVSLAASGPFVATVERAEWKTASGERRSQCAAAVYEVREGLVQNVWYFDAHPCSEGPKETP